MKPDSPGARIVLLGLKLYKVLISPLFAGSCRYLPSCSDYMAEAVRRHGVLSGLFLGLKRLGRCHPWGGSGLDPVPEKPGSGTRDSGSGKDQNSRRPSRRPRASALGTSELHAARGSRQSAA